MKNLKTIWVILFIILTALITKGQETTLKGRVLTEDLEILSGATIYDKDTTVLGVTNWDGYFNIEIPFDIKYLLFGFVGMEWTTLEIQDDCKYLEVILLSDAIYDFIPLRRINKKRYKRFKQLTKRHQEAYDLELFNSKTICGCYTFRKHD